MSQVGDKIRNAESILKEEGKECILEWKPTKGLVRSTYLIDENGIIVNAFGAFKPKDNAAQMLGALE